MNNLNLNSLYDFLSSGIIGQERALEKVAKIFKTALVLKTESDTPKVVALFLGPTGVGKTETCKLLAQFIFGNTDKLNVFNMSEFGTKDGIAEFRGGPGDPKGRFGNFLNDNDSGIVLFDEMEKAHPDFHNLFLQMFGEGAQISTYDGENYSVKNFFFILTSNVGSSKLVNVADRTKYDLIEQSIFNSLRAEFKLEYINRIKYKIVFDCLRNETQRKIVPYHLNRYIRNFEKSHSFNVYYNDDVVNYIVRYGIDRRFGARKLKNFIEEHAGSAITDAIISGNDSEGFLTVNAKKMKFANSKNDVLHLVMNKFEKEHPELKIDRSVVTHFESFTFDDIKNFFDNIYGYLVDNYAGKQGLLTLSASGQITVDDKYNTGNTNDDFREIFSFYRK